MAFILDKKKKGLFKNLFKHNLCASVEHDATNLHLKF